MKTAITYTFLTILLTASIYPTNVSATELSTLNNQETIDQTTPESVAENLNTNPVWGNVKSNGYIYVNDQKYNLQITLESPQVAMVKFCDKYSTFLAAIKKDTGFDDLSKQNYKQYYEYIREYGSNYFSDQDINDVFAFFDLYENNDNNTLISELANYVNSSQQKNNLNLLKNEKIGKNEAIDLLNALSPEYNEELPNEEIENTPSLYSVTFNITKANTYAKSYGAKRNSKYKSYSADCTNFASQILVAGGLKTNYIWKPYTNTWVNANRFANYFGKKNSSKKWKTFEKNLVPGKFIGADWGGDGVIDHIAYCAGTKSNKYIAQHTSDYYKKPASTAWINDTKTRVLWIVG